MMLSSEALYERLAELPIERRRAIAEAGRQLAEREGLDSPEIPFAFHHLPIALDRERVSAALRSCGAVVQGLIRLERRALGADGGEIRDRLLASLDPPGRRLFELCNFESDYSVERRFRRVDAMIEPGGAGGRVLEVNQAAPAFIHFHDALQRIASEQLGMIGFDHEPDLLAPRVAAWLVGEYRHRYGTGAAPETIAVVSEEGYLYKRLELPAFTAACERAARDRLGCDTAFRLCFPHELSLRDGRVWLGDRRIDMIWRNSALLDSYAGREQEIEDYRRILARHDEHLIVNSTRVWLTLTKDALSLLSSGPVLVQLGFTPDERSQLLDAVPRTVSLAREPDVADEILRSREEWISKPAAGSFSQGFEAGWWHTDASWLALVRERSSREFVFQRFVRRSPGDLCEIDSAGELHRRTVTYEFSPHHVDGAFPGTVLVRARVDGAKGGRIVPVIVV